MTKLTEVFGVSADPVLSYIVRDNIDGLFTTVLKEDKHVVIYGASKQGKEAASPRELRSGQLRR